MNRNRRIASRRSGPDEGEQSAKSIRWDRSDKLYGVYFDHGDFGRSPILNDLPPR
jgi:hypothetical protein